MVGLLILYPFRWRMGRTAPSVMGFKNLLDCQEVARGPVSASPSPTINGCDQIRIVKYSSESMSDRIAELAALIDGTGGFRGTVAWVRRRGRRTV